MKRYNYSLRTLLIVMLLTPPLLAAIWTFWQHSQQANQKKPLAIDLKLGTNSTSEEQAFSFYLGITR